MREEQIDIIIDDLLIDFDEMSFAPTTTVPNPEAYAIEWRNKLTDVLQGYRKQSEWISVEERLPEIGDHYLVVVKQKYDWEDEWHYDTDVAAFVFFDGYIDDVWETFVDWKEGQETHVTHWMPLPEVPEEFAAHTIPRSQGVAKWKWETVPDHILNTPSTYRHRCIKCDYFYKDKRPYGHKYCPGCGAKMEGGEE